MKKRNFILPKIKVLLLRTLEQKKNVICKFHLIINSVWVSVDSNAVHFIDNSDGGGGGRGGREWVVWTIVA